jgi:hypothetical protein
MAEGVKKRERVPDVLAEFKPPTAEKEIFIEVGEKKYPLPHLKLKEYKKILKVIDEVKDRGEATELENIEFAQNFFYTLLKPYHPELKKTDMEEMPLFQCGAEFFIKVQLALYRIPLD